jgi:nucleotide-binding universal stress UspA family protein
MKTILAPVDFSPVTEAVLKEALLLARALSARIVLLHTTQPPVITSEYAPLMSDLDQVIALGEKAAEKNLTRLQTRLTAAGVRCDTLQLTGMPVSNIVAQAKKLAADHVVMGSHGHTAFYELLVGSTTHGVLTKVACPVVIVPAPKARKKATGKKRK